MRTENTVPLHDKDQTVRCLFWEAHVGLLCWNLMFPDVLSGYPQYLQTNTG